MFFILKISIYILKIYFSYFESVLLDRKNICLCYEKLFYHGLLVVGRFPLNLEIGRRVPDQNRELSVKTLPG